MGIIGIIVLAVIVEGLISYSKTFFVDKQVRWQILVGIGIGVAVSLTYNIDLLGLVGMEAAFPYAGSVLTGVLISRGSNYVFELLRLQEEIVAKLRK